MDSSKASRSDGGPPAKKKAITDFFQSWRVTSSRDAQPCDSSSAAIVVADDEPPVSTSASQPTDSPVCAPADGLPDDSPADTAPEPVAVANPWPNDIATFFTRDRFTPSEKAELISAVYCPGKSLEFPGRSKYGKTRHF